VPMREALTLFPCTSSGFLLGQKDVTFCSHGSECEGVKKSFGILQPDDGGSNHLRNEVQLL
jgi:hypothetical protein